MNIKRDIFLFENDLQEYQASIEGQKVINELNKDNRDMDALKMALNEYWTARNDTGLHYNSEQDKIKGIKNDNYIASLYREQN